MSRFSILAVLCAAIIFISASAVMAAVVTPAIVNGGFESPAQGKIKGWDNGDNPAIPGDPGNPEEGIPPTPAIPATWEIPGWASDVKAIDSGAETPSKGYNSTYTGYLMGGLNNWSGATYAEPSAFNVTDYVIASGDEFHLSVMSKDSYTATAEKPATVGITLFYTDGAGNTPGIARTVLKTQNFVLTTAWTEYKLDLSAAETVAGVGHKIGVELFNVPFVAPPGNAHTWINVDQVQFVPEPATWTMLVLGGLAMLVWRKRS
jgi:hypothetical protein